MLSCKQITENASDYTDAQVGLLLRVRMGLHLTMCTHCRAYMRQIGQTIGVVQRMPPPPVPEDTKAQSMQVFRQWKSSGSHSDVDVPQLALATPNHLVRAVWVTLIAAPLLIAINHGICLMSGAFTGDCATQSFLSALVPFAVAYYASVRIESLRRTTGE